MQHEDSTGPRKRVLYVVTRPDFFSQNGGVGGHITHAHGVVSGLSANDREVLVVAGDYTNCAPDTRHFPVHGSGRLLWTIRLLRTLNAIARANPDLEFVYIRYAAAISPLLPVIRLVFRGIPIVMEVNSLASQSVRAWRFIDRAALSDVDVVLVVSNELREFVLSEISPALSSSLLVLPNGVDPERFSRTGRATPPSSDRPFVFGYVGVLKPGYGLEELIRAFVTFVNGGANAHLRIVGAGPQLADLEAEFGSEERVQFTGGFDYAEVESAYAGIECLLYSTSQANAFQSPIKVLEYMLTGVPILAARTPSTARMLDGGRLGALYKLDDRSSLIDGLTRAVTDHDAARGRAAEARLDVLQNHTWKARMATLIAAVDDLAP